MRTYQKKILFVGSFKKTSKDGGVGGQMFASKTIVNAMSSEVDWVLLDTTAKTNLKRNFIFRALGALNRLILFCYYLSFFKFDHIVIFVANGWSFWEKGLMSILAKQFSRAKIILAPRSGFIVNDIAKKGILFKFICKVFNKVDTIICQSQSWQNLFFEVSEIEKNKLVVIENMIDFKKYNKIPLKSSTSQNHINILFLAWVTRKKGIFELLDAILLLNKDNLNFKLTIAGKGEDYEEVSNFILKQNLTEKIELKGWILGDEKMEILADSDIFVLPTHFEGYPNSLIEAMASGKSCIASKVGSIPDIIKDKKNGFLIEPENHIQLYNCLKKLITDHTLREEFGVKARIQIKQENSVEVGIKKLKKLLEIC